MTAVLQRSPDRVEAPPTLLEPAPRVLGLGDQLSLWANLGITLTIPVAAAFVLQPGMSLLAAGTAVLVGTVLGSVVLALAAVVGAQTGAPAMVLLRGMLGGRASIAPTILNLLQCVGWATVEVVVIANAAAALTTPSLRWLYVLLAGAAATALAVFPLGMVRLLRRYAVWLVLVAGVYLFVRLLDQPLPDPTHGSWSGFWLSVDVVVALPVSWAPLAADYSRYSRTARATFWGTFAGFGSACAASFALGLVAVAGVAAGSPDVLAVLLAVPAGALALTILVADEIDEAFANVYSTAASIQNLRPDADRRRLAVAIGVVATALGLAVSMTGYESFLYLIGSVFVPLFAVLLVDWFLVSRGRWDLSRTAPTRVWMAVPWLLGFVTYQLVNPGSVGWWARPWTALRDVVGFEPATWMSASLLSFAVAAVLTVPAGWLDRRTRRQPPGEAEPGVVGAGGARHDGVTNWSSTVTDRAS